jgi:hypothetical protein
MGLSDGSPDLTKPPRVPHESLQSHLFERFTATVGGVRPGGSRRVGRRTATGQAKRVTGRGGIDRGFSLPRTPGCDDAPRRALEPASASGRLSYPSGWPVYGEAELTYPDGRLACLDGRLAYLGGRHAYLDGRLAYPGGRLAYLEGRRTYL